MASILIDYQPHRPYGIPTLAFADPGQQVSKLTCHAYAQLRARLCLRQFERAIPNVRLLHPKHIGRPLTREVREVHGVAKRLIGRRPER